jgi:hypothetical protein
MLSGAKIECAVFTKLERRDGTARQGEPMKNVFEVLQQKEADLTRVQHEIESLRTVASLLSDELPTEELTRKRVRSEEEILESGSEQATGTDGMFSSSDAAAPPSFWNTLRRQK